MKKFMIIVGILTLCFCILLIIVPLYFILGSTMEAFGNDADALKYYIKSQPFVTAEKIMDLAETSDTCLTNPEDTVYSLSGSEYHLYQNGVLTVRGINNWNQNGIGDHGHSKNERFLEFVVMTGVTKLSVPEVEYQNAHALALDSFGNVYGWGVNQNGEALPGSEEREVMRPVLLLEGAKDIFAAVDCSYALMQDGRILAWGEGYDGFEETGWEIEIKQISGNSKSLLILDTQGNLYGTGSNGHGFLGLEGVNDAPEPTLVMTGIEKVFTWDAYGDDDGLVYALTAKGEVYRWGYDGETIVRPQMVMDGVKEFNSAYGLCAALMENGDLFAWGYNRLRMIPADRDIVNETVKIAENVTAFEVYYLSITYKNESGVVMLGKTFEERVEIVGDMT